MMEGGKYFCYNGKHFTSGKAVISADNRCFRYGDGFFETMKMINGKIRLESYHLERLFSSLQILQFEKPGYFTDAFLLTQIKKITDKNQHTALSKIRLNIFRGNGSVYEPENNLPNYIIQTGVLDQGVLKLNKTGLITNIYTRAKKTCDDFSHIKSNNYLPYIMAAFWAKANKLDDAIVLNTNNRLCDATIANIFLLKNGKVRTPALSEGCINGVMRRRIIKTLKQEGISCEETKIEADEIKDADEMFLTNAVREIQWVKRCGAYNYQNKFVRHIHNLNRLKCSL